MHIEWNITKRRGNIRPVLHYTVTLEEHERELALPFIRVVSTIPEPPDSWQEFCYPGQHERAENPAKLMIWKSLPTKDVSGNRACAFLGAKKTTIPKSNNHSKNYATLSKRN